MANYYCNSNMVDQGAARAEDDFVCGPESLKEIIDFVGTTNKATIICEGRSVAQTTYTLTTSESIPANIKLRIENGAVWDGAGTLTLDNAGQIDAGPDQYVFGSSITVVFTNGGEDFSKWWYGGTGYHNVSIQSAIDSIASSGGIVTMPGGTLQTNAVITIINNDIILQGTGGAGNSDLTAVETNRATTIENKSGTAHAIHIGIIDVYISGITLRDFAIDGDSGAAAAGCGIVLDSYNYPAGVSHCELTNLSIHHCKDYGIWLKGNVYESSINKVDVRNCTEGIVAGHSYGTCAQITYSGVGMWENTNYGWKDGGTVISQSFFGCWFGVNTTGAQSVLGSYYNGCYFEENTSVGLSVEGQGTTIMGGTFDGNDVTGLDFVGGGSAGSTLFGGFFNDNTTQDILIQAGARSVTIINPDPTNPYDGSAGVVITNNERTAQIIGQNWHLMTAAGAARTWGTTEFDSTAGAMAVTLANGTFYGQQKRFYLDTDGGDVTLTVANHALGGNTVFTFDTAQDYLTLEWDQAKWNTVVSKFTTFLKGSDTWDPGSIGDGDEEAKEITVTGAALGDFVMGSFSLDVADLALDCAVTASDTVTCTLSNNTSGAIDLGSGTISVEVIRK